MRFILYLLSHYLLHNIVSGHLVLLLFKIDSFTTTETLLYYCIGIAS